MEARLDFRGSGHELFRELFLRVLLTGMTLGLFAPWLVVATLRAIASRTKVLGTARGDLRLEYDATGGALFRELAICGLLTLCTLGMYTPWLFARLVRFHQAHARAIDSRGNVYQLLTRAQGGELLTAGLPGLFFTVITLGLFAPWLFCELAHLIAERTDIFENGDLVGHATFSGQGRALFAAIWTGQLLTVLTLGIYAAWLHTKLLAFALRHTQIHVHGSEIVHGDFDGLGGELFGIGFGGAIFTVLTGGIYGFWLLNSLLRYQLAHVAYRKTGRPSLLPSVPAFAPGLAVA